MKSIHCNIHVQFQVPIVNGNATEILQEQFHVLRVGYASDNLTKTIINHLATVNQNRDIIFRFNRYKHAACFLYPKPVTSVFRD